MQAADGSKTVCQAYVCRDGACLDKCTSTNDCLNGFACDGSKCIATSAAATGDDGGGCGLTPRADAGAAVGAVAVRARRAPASPGHFGVGSTVIEVSDAALPPPG